MPVQKRCLASAAKHSPFSARFPGVSVRRRMADYRAGDAVVLRLDVVHMSANNVSGDLRLSADTRWQSAEEPRDERIAQWRGLGGPATA